MGKNLEITKSLESYIEKFSNELDPIQKEIISYNKTLGDIKKMQITTSQCFFLELIIKITGAKNVLEIGTFTGLSALSMSLGLPDDGRLITLDKNVLTNNIANIFFRKAKQEKKIKTISKPALESIIDLKKNNNFFDVIFIDADKKNYKNYYDKSLSLIKKNSLIIIDNVLWYGEVADEKNNDKITQIMRNFNIHVKNDKKTEQVILPLGDGLTICRKL
jgi:predicted O-methyltransferase YrrM|tara:strand:+ start:1465 stop:2121 length:657 start_codon:yes stop_codon:yes gene_type:complete